MAWTAPTLGLLLCAGSALASEPTVTKDGDQSGQMVANYTNPASSSPSNVPSTIPTLTPNIVAPGQAVRQINLDPNKMRQVSGPVVKRSGLILYVQDVTGPVVPLDMSNLTIYKPPLKGQQVLALYQVDETDNVALSLQGEKQD
ncbi:hypothetical protein [Corallococcus exiguus]|uniref:hypothetical protein n=1 Tax=Corallococcus exiguus TaxID=83462 RepID=UPI0014948E51|nr:hypothetical protein [Corallococcus exiguus]NPD26982.1 hypothetical protein [Corallococcus exiguus]